MTETQNPLLNLLAPLREGPQGAIPFDRVHASHARPAVDELLQRARLAVDAVRQDEASPSYDNTLAALDEATEELELAMTVLGHLESVATNDDLRDAYNEVLPLTSAFWSELSMDEALFSRATALAESEEATALDPTRARYLHKTLEAFRRQGAALDDEKKARLGEINTRLSEVTTRFAQNVLDATNDYELILEEAQLAGLPESAIAAARASAEQAGKEGYRFTLHAPSLIPLLTYLDDGSIREKVYRVYGTRASSGERDNAPLMREILALRAEKAALLGYADFADLVLEDRMAKTGAKAKAFVDDLVARTRPAFDAENDELRAFRRELEGEDAPELRPWDISYYAEKLRRARFDFDEEALRPYFPVTKVLPGLFGIAERLYSVSIEKVDRPTWDEAVEVYAINEEGRTIAEFYVDLYPRENKRGGAWMNPIRSETEGGPQRGLFCANVTPPAPPAPALLTHREVETLFHEFGHLLHHALSTVSVRSLAGTNVAWDFVELPSQIMENWCWEREALDLFARHHETGDAIPSDLFEKMQRARTFRAANAQMRQLGFASVDLSLHTDYDESRDGPIVQYARDALQRFAPARYPEEYAMITAFTHLFAGPVAYASGYYSYKWAEVLDADAFSRFASEGITSPVVGAAFREAVLSKGDSRDPAELYREFMGRDPDLEPLLRRAGLA